MIEFIQKQHMGDISNVQRIASELDIAMTTATILVARGYDDIDSARKFLYPSTDQLHDPYLFEGMQDAVDCIFAAGNSGALICVYGDYDADGICATSILYRYLKSQGFEVLPYIPTRHDEGYGLNVEAIEELAGKGVELIVTVDCGVTAFKEIALAYELGMEVVLTDHHQCKQELPECEAVINPVLGNYPFKSLCGAGVAFKIVQAMGGLEAAMEYVDLAAIATVADIVNIVDENRVIVTEGLKRIRSGCSYDGITALLEVCGCSCARVDSQIIGFSMAPRINAAGRTGSAQHSLELFLTDEPTSAKRLAKLLDEENKKRQQIELKILDDALKYISEGKADIVNEPVLILYDEGWNSGVIGIVASRLTRRFHRPVLLFGGENGEMTASGRSIPGIHLYDCLSGFSEYFLRFGGHEMAAGLTIKSSVFQEFRAKFLGYMRENLDPNILIPKSEYDVELPVPEIDRKLIDDFSVLAPFGTGNPAPLFCIRNVRPKNVISIGNDNQHIRFEADGLQCIAFGEGHQIKTLRSESIDIIATAELNHFNGRTSIQAIVRTLRVSPPNEISKYISKREWNFYDALCLRIGYNIKMGTAKLPVSLSEERMQQLTVEKLFERPQATIILCFSPEGARRLLDFLISGGHAEKIGFHWGIVNDPSAYNCALFAPDLNQSNLSGYENVFIWDDIPDPVAASELMSGGFSEIYRQAADLSAFLGKIRFSRDDLANSYRAIITQSRKNTQFTDFTAYVAAINQFTGFDPFFVCFSLRVFAQLGIVSLSNNGCFIVRAVSSPQKKELTDSSVFFAAQKVLDEYENMRSMNV